MLCHAFNGQKRYQTKQAIARAQAYIYRSLPMDCKQEIEVPECKYNITTYRVMLRD